MTRFAVGALILGTCVYLFQPGKFFRLPLDKPLLWLVIMIFYPLFSVIPQELIYRIFFFRRYNKFLKGKPVALITCSALCFSFAHLVFWNWQALLLTAIGGVLFGYTYYKTESYLCVCIEHALWDNFIFTVGMGNYFLGGTVAALLS